MYYCCSSMVIILFDRIGIQLNSVALQVLVPPSVAVPSLSPSDVSVVDFSSEAWTFTCIAHSAYPPVQLNWIKVYVCIE
jgi:hypothetical protein